jgi:uncharacterized membrane protein YbhN (UPF0104 family)
VSSETVESQPEVVMTDDLRVESTPEPDTGTKPAPVPSSLAGIRRRADALLARARIIQQRVPRLVAFTRSAYYPVALAIVAYFLYSTVRKVDVSKLHWVPLVFSYVFALGWWLSLGLGWSALITERFEFIPVANWCKTQVPRYLPGGIWAPVARATTVKGRVRNKVAAVFAENITLLFVALGVGALWAGVHNPLFIPGIVLGFVPIIAIRWLEKRSAVTRKGVRRASITYAVGFVCYGIAGLLSQISFSGLHRPTYPLYVAGASCVAWAIGLVVVFAPGGVGVRELVYVWMLSDLTYSSTELKGAAIANRIASIFAELTVLAIVTRPRLRRGAERRESERAARERTAQEAA